ncbi:single-stranded DNA-binding protein [Xanthomonas axonopodis]|uniref:single-stranded DNA-binding protein n=1 Tax=Xanthomonas axonopodis TaxID=53413 RepID=UPI003558BBEA
MSNLIIFTGRLAATPELETRGETKLTRIRLIRNEYAGKDNDGNRRERVVSVQFTAFGGQAEHLANNGLVGDQLQVEATIRNNNYTDGDGRERYEFNFQIVDFEFGAPGAEKRKQWAEGKGKQDDASPAPPKDEYDF